MKFFKNKGERELWIKLNAERIYYHQKKSNNKFKMGDINTPYTAMTISHNQLIYDEKKNESLRLSFEELLNLSPDELNELYNRRLTEKYNNSLKKNVDSCNKTLR